MCIRDRVRAALGQIDRWNPLTDYDRLLCIYEYMQDTMAYDLRELQACRRLDVYKRQRVYSANRKITFNYWHRNYTDRYN